MTGRDFPQLVLAASLNARRRPILPFILSLVVLGVLLYFMGWLPMGDAGKAGRWVRNNTTFLLFAGAALILSRSPGLAVLGMAVLAYTLTQRTGWLFGGGRNGRKRQHLDREDGLSRNVARPDNRRHVGPHAPGAIRGPGAFEPHGGGRLDCLAELRANDSQAARLFEAYLDRAFPGWEGGGAGAGPGGASPSRGMGVEEAYLVLGLNPGATRGEIHAAHRNLMKRFHPDQGGSTYLASKVNEAKDVLLKNVNG